MIKTGCHTQNFGHASLEDAMSFIRQLGFRYVDAAASGIGKNAQVDQEEAAADPRGLGLRTRELAARHGLELEELFMCSVYVNGVRVETNVADDGIRNQMYKNFEAICRYAREAGFKSVMGVPGIPQETLGREASFERSVEALKQMVSIAEGCGLQLNVEPHRGPIIHRPGDAITMLGEVRGLKLTLDFLHYKAFGIPQREAMPLLEHAGHMHARQARPGWPKCPVELGTIDYGAIVGRLKELGWDGVISVEYWNGPRENEAGINPVFQNVLMAYELERLIKGQS